MIQIYCRRPSLVELDALVAVGVRHVAWGVMSGDEAALALSRAMAARARAKGVESCLLVHSDRTADVVEIAGSIGPDYLLVPAEVAYDTPVRELGQRLDPGISLMMSVPVRPPGSRTKLASRELARRFAELADCLILDTSPDPEAKETCGCTGVTNDWEECARIVADSPVPVVLAGGLGPANVAAAIEKVRPWGVDACTSLEHPDRSKDLARCEAFVAAARNGFRRLVA